MENFSFTEESGLHSDKATVWRHVTQMKNVNAELMPFVRMTYPADRAALDGQDVPLNQTLLTSVILLFGIIPIDLHYLAFDKIVPEEGFYEHSVTFMHRYWKHERTLTEKDGRVMVKDKVTFHPRLFVLGHILLPVYRFVFRHRHRRLHKAFTV